MSTHEPGVRGVGCGNSLRRGAGDGLIGSGLDAKGVCGNFAFAGVTFFFAEVAERFGAGLGRTGSA